MSRALIVNFIQIKVLVVSNKFAKTVVLPESSIFGLT